MSASSRRSSRLKARNKSPARDLAQSAERYDFAALMLAGETGDQEIRAFACRQRTAR